jgi:hypothetical protein
VTGEGIDALLDAVAAVLYGLAEQARGGAGKKLGKRRAAR